jgi:hypothetical protein
MLFVTQYPRLNNAQQTVLGKPGTFEELNWCIFNMLAKIDCIAIKF